jgi:hypothetical protein
MGRGPSHMKQNQLFIAPTGLPEQNQLFVAATGLPEPVPESDSRRNIMTITPGVWQSLFSQRLSAQAVGEAWALNQWHWSLTQFWRRGWWWGALCGIPLQS